MPQRSCGPARGSCCVAQVTAIGRRIPKKGCTKAAGRCAYCRSTLSAEWREPCVHPLLQPIGTASASAAPEAQNDQRHRRSCAPYLRKRTPKVASSLLFGNGEAHLDLPAARQSNQSRRAGFHAGFNPASLRLPGTSACARCEMEPRVGARPAIRVVCLLSQRACTSGPPRFSGTQADADGHHSYRAASRALDRRHAGVELLQRKHREDRTQQVVRRRPPDPAL
jgi:hypothetical protein